MLTARHSCVPPPRRPRPGALGGLAATEQQMKSTHVIYRQCFLLKNNCGDRDWARGSMAMDFSAVGSCIVGHNERWEEREGRSGRENAVFRFFFPDARKMSDRSLDTRE